MANTYFDGNAEPVAMVTEWTPVNPFTDTIYSLISTGLDGSVTKIDFRVAAVETVAAVIAGLVAAWNASTDPNCTPYTAVDNTTTIRIVADEPGIAFSIVSDVVDGGGGGVPTLLPTVVTANISKYDWTNIDNWRGGVIPIVGDNVYVTDAKILYNLDQSAGGLWPILSIKRSQFGVNPAPGTVPIYFQCTATLIEIDEDSDIGVSVPIAPILIDNGAIACTINVYNAGASDDATQPAVRVLANHAAAYLNVKAGVVGVGFNDGESGQFATISELSAAASIFVGVGITLATLTKYAGECKIKCAVTTVLNAAGNLITEGSAALGTVTNSGGTFIPNSSGTITLINGSGGIVDTLQSNKAMTISEIKLAPGCTYKHHVARVTLTTFIKALSTSGKIQFVCASVA